jgi:DNA helicase-2/ATP-dependent DNA helicase PcrA
LSQGQRVAVITYTNAASEVISQRLKFDPLIQVSTIHSFAWGLIGTYHSDIRRWIRNKLEKDIAELQETLSKTRPGTKVRLERESSLAEKKVRLALLARIRAFTYSPTGENSTRDSLSHAEVISICADFLRKEALQAIVVGRFPYLFVDESQDTNKDLIESFFALEAGNQGRFCLGLFGDMMQRIYMDGKPKLEGAVPPGWATPEKKMNWRCPPRVVSLINEVRKPVDERSQIPAPGKPEGFVRCFILPSNVEKKEQLEDGIARKMAEITADPNWISIEGRKTLILEHHMAAKRLRFADFFMPLYGVRDFRTGLLDGSLSGIPLFIRAILPLTNAIKEGNQFEVARVIRSQSPLLKAKNLRSESDPAQNLERVRVAVREIEKCMQGVSVNCMDILKIVSAHGLFELPENLRATLRADAAGIAAAPDDPNVTTEGAIAGWHAALQAPLSQLAIAASYLSETSSFDTHQGVKGREFPRVMVIMDDEDARGFTFHFDKLFEVTPKSKGDLEKEAEGEETSSDKTRRLFYVTCSRAESSLALVVYTADPPAAKDFLSKKGWFSAAEIEMLEV